MEFQLFPFRTGVCGHRQKSSLAEPQRQLARPSAYICRKGRLVLTAQRPCSQPVPLTEPSASRAAALLWDVPVGAIRCQMLLRSISDLATILIMLAGQRGNSQRRANPLLWADPQSHWGGSQLWPSVKLKDRTTELAGEMESEAASTLRAPWSGGGGWGSLLGGTQVTGEGPSRRVEEPGRFSFQLRCVTLRTPFAVSGPLLPDLTNGADTTGKSSKVVTGLLFTAVCTAPGSRPGTQSAPYK